MILEKQFVVASAQIVKVFASDNVERLVSIDYVSPQAEEKPVEVGISV